MGLFSSKEVYVDSVVYNMAGDPLDRPDFLKSTVFSNVLNNSRFSMSETIVSSYLNGPGIKVRSFYRWAKRAGNYNTIGVPTVQIYSPGYPYGTINSQIPYTAPETTRIQAVNFGPTDYSYWAEQYVMLHYQDMVGTAWTADYDEIANLITITWDPELLSPPGGSPTLSFTPTGLVEGERYYYVTYGLYTTATGSLTYIGARMWIYRYGSGNATMDAIPVSNPIAGDFVPFIPLRKRNQFIGTDFMPEVYAQTKKAYKKATGQKLSKLIETLADNEDIDDIDNIYMVPGVALNTTDKRSRRYLFKFFDFMRTQQVVDYEDYTDFSTNTLAFQEVSGRFYTARQIDYTGEPGGSSDPIVLDDPGPAPTEPINEVNIKTTGSYDAKLDMSIIWNAIVKTTSPGLGKVGAKVGDVWWSAPEISDPETGALVSLLNAIETIEMKKTVVRIYYQVSDSSYEVLEITGLRHRNNVYKGHTVKISAPEALNDSDESGFVIPLHYETLRSMSLVDSTQMSLASTYLIFNCYKVVKRKWYQTGIFKILMVVAIVAISFVTGGGPLITLLSSGGLLGVVGGAGIFGKIMSKITNMLTGMILGKLLNVFGSAIFGEQLFGKILSIASMAAATIVGFGMGGGAAMWGGMSAANNMMGINQAGGMDKYAQKSAALMKEYNAASKAIQEQYAAQFGDGKLLFDPMTLTTVYEAASTFLDRSLMTGTDVAQMSMDMIENFAQYTLNPDTSGR